METPLQDLLDRIDDVGCPRCDDEVLRKVVGGPDDVNCYPCGHRVGIR